VQILFTFTVQHVADPVLIYQLVLPSKCIICIFLLWCCI